MVSWDRNKFKKLKRTYNKARKASEDVFEFEGNQLDINYAKYLLMYLDKALPK